MMNEKDMIFATTCSACGREAVTVQAPEDGWLCEQCRIEDISQKICEFAKANGWKVANRSCSEISEAQYIALTRGLENDGDQEVIRIRVAAHPELDYSLEYFVSETSCQLDSVLKALARRCHHTKGERK